MSRPKSPARIQADRDKTIRKERRERKRQECEARRKERERKRAIHESIVKNNGISPIHSGGEQLGLRDAMTYSPLVLCGGCGAIIRKSALIGDLCPTCKYGKEVIDEKIFPLSVRTGDTPTGAAGPLEAQDERRRA
jgi:hypothetical protein